MFRCRGGAGMSRWCRGSVEDRGEVKVVSGWDVKVVFKYRGGVEVV